MAIGVVIHVISLFCFHKVTKYIPMFFYIAVAIMVLNFEMVWISNVLLGIDKNQFDPVWIASIIFWTITVVTDSIGLIMRDKKGMIAETFQSKE